MKAVIIGGGVVLGLILGYWPRGVDRQKPFWWRVLATLSLVVTVVLALGVPTGGDFDSALKVSMARGNETPVPIFGTIVSITNSPAHDGRPASQTPDMIELKDVFGTVNKVTQAGQIVADQGLKPGDRVLLDVSIHRPPLAYVAVGHVATNPWITLPLIPGLEERARNLYFHVPCAWLAQLAWFVAFAFAIVTLRKGRPEDDIRMTAAAGLGALFCVLATITGSVWARFNWGMFWNWDPRQIAIFVVLVIFGAYFALRSAVSNEEQRSRLSAAYLILMLLPVIFFLFVFPRMTEGLHPGAADSGNAGPVLSSDPDALNPTKQVIFGLSFFSFQLLYFWMLNLTVRVRLAAHRRRVAGERAFDLPPTPAVTAIDADSLRQP